MMFCLFIPALLYARSPVGIGVKDVLSTTGPQMGSAIIAVVFGVIMQPLFLPRIIRASKVYRLHSDLRGDLPDDATRPIQNKWPLDLASSLLRDFGPLKRWA